MMKRGFLVLSLPFFLVACQKSETKTEPGTEPAPKAAEGDPAPAAEAPAPAAGPLTLAKVGNLKITAPAGTEVGDGIGGSGAMLQGPGLVLIVEEASDTRPKTVKEAKENADMYTPKNLASEDLTDGFVVTWDNEGSAGKNYFVNVRRELGGKGYWCETTASTPEQAANAIAACKSLAL